MCFIKERACFGLSNKFSSLTTILQIKLFKFAKWFIKLFIICQFPKTYAFKHAIKETSLLIPFAGTFLLPQKVKTFL